MFNKGQSIIEVIVAVSILIIIAASGTIAILGAFQTTRLAEEETQATLIAQTGIEATQSIRNQGWDNLINGDHGLSNTSGLWSFSSTSDLDTSAKFTRVVTISDVERGGIVDPETKKIVSTVTWNFSPLRNLTVDLTTYLTNWQLTNSSGVIIPPVISTCADFCQNQGYSTGTCRQNTIQCTNNSETNLPAGDQYCVGGASVDTCCCLPL